jgi:hypothetical protein
VVLVGLAIYGVVRWRRRREAQAQRELNAHEPASASRSSETPRS